jgi:hypothetical protein
MAHNLYPADLPELIITPDLVADVAVENFAMTKILFADRHFYLEYYEEYSRGNSNDFTIYLQGFVAPTTQGTNLATQILNQAAVAFTSFKHTHVHIFGNECPAWMDELSAAENYRYTPLFERPDTYTFFEPDYTHPIFTQTYTFRCIISFSRDGVTSLFHPFPLYYIRACIHQLIQDRPPTSSDSDFIRTPFYNPILSPAEIDLLNSFSWHLRV